jgi:hypothetical protein
MPVRDLLNAASSQGAGPSDPYFYDVSLLLNGDGTNGAQNNTFLDSSSNAFTITRNGNTTQGSFSPYGNLWSNYFNGSNAYLTTPQNAAFNLGTGAFTVEGWVYITSTPSGNIRMIGLGNGAFGGTAYDGWSFNIDSLTTLSWYRYDGSTETAYNASYSFSLNTWYHIVAVRNGSSNLSTYVNGVRVYNNASATVSYDNINSDPLYIGYVYDGSSGGPNHYFPGYISNTRIVKGTAVYDPTQTTLTVPTAPLTAISGTSLLTCQSNQFIDNSSNNFTISVTGSPSVQRFSPFNPTAPYSTTTIGGSGYFGGSGDYLNTASNSAFAPGTGDFAIQCWVNFTSLPTYSPFFQNETNILAAGTDKFWFAYYNGNLWLGRHSSSNHANAAWTPSLNTWYHVAVSRVSGTIYMFINGVSQSVTNPTVFNGVSFSQNGVAIGVQSGTPEYLIGYISDLQYQVGTGFTSIALPTAPISASTNCQLLTNMTNAGIPDLAMQNDLQTVGSAQVSTSVVKYGTGSLYFPSSGTNYLALPTNPIYAFGTGDFTIEGWINFPLTQESAICATRTSAGNANAWSLAVTTGGSIYMYSNAYVFQSSSGTISANTWTHIAVTRSGSTVKLFINGVTNQTNSNNSDFSVSTFAVGASSDGTQYPCNGYIDDFRITNGYARYTSNFTPPTSALPTY